MPGPSAAILINSVSFYAFVASYDADAGIDGTANEYPTLTATIQCSIQPADVEQVFDQTGRVTSERRWRILTDLTGAKAIPALKAKDKAVWVDFLGNTHTIFIDGPWTDQAGRGVAFRAVGTEKV